MRKRMQRLAMIALGIVGLGWSVFAQTAGNSNEGADFSPKPPIQAKTPQEEAKSFMLPPGYRMELVLAEPDIISPAVIEFDGNGRMYVAEFVHLHARCRRQRRSTNRSDRITPLGEHEGRRRLRQAHGLRRQARAAAHDPAARRQQHPHQRDRLGRRRQAAPTPTTTASPTSARSSTQASASAATATSSTSRAGSSGASTTGSTAPTTRSASAGRRSGILREPTGTERRSVGPDAGRRRQDVVRRAPAASAAR